MLYFTVLFSFVDFCEADKHSKVKVHSFGRFFRRCWVTFDRAVNIKEICWNLQNIRVCMPVSINEWLSVLLFSHVNGFVFVFLPMNHVFCTCGLQLCKRFSWALFLRFEWGTRSPRIYKHSAVFVKRCCVGKLLVCTYALFLALLNSVSFTAARLRTGTCGEQRPGPESAQRQRNHSAQAGPPQWYKASC